MTSTKLRMQHVSLQHSDNATQQRHDVKKLFSQGKAYPIKTGTEAFRDPAGKNHNRDLLLEYAEEYDHKITFASDTWVAVDRAIINPGSAQSHNVLLLDKKHIKQKSTDKRMAMISFDHVKSGVGHISVGSVHYPTGGGFPGSPNWRANKTMAEKIALVMKEQGRGSGVAFVNGDFNMNDRKRDWAFGQNFTSMADQLGVYFNTGHGPIDGFCSYDLDERVTASKLIVQNDKKFFLNTDHFRCLGVWDIEHMK